MSSWERIQRLPVQFQEQTLVLYNKNCFPIEVRKALSDWIDKQNWQSLTADSPEVNSYLTSLAQEFFGVLEVSGFGGVNSEKVDWTLQGSQRDVLPLPASPNMPVSPEYGGHWSRASL